MAKVKDLKPCSVCRATNISTIHNDDKDFYVVCWHCCHRGLSASTGKEARDKWNEEWEIKEKAPNQCDLIKCVG